MRRRFLSHMHTGVQFGDRLFVAAFRDRLVCCDHIPGRDSAGRHSYLEASFQHSKDPPRDRKEDHDQEKSIDSSKNFLRFAVRRAEFIVLAFRVPEP